MVSIFYYILIGMVVLIRIRIRQKWTQIRMRIRCKTRGLTDKDSVTGGWFSRTIMEGTF